MKKFLRLYWSKLLLLLLLFAAATRAGNLFAALDYDEIWTMSYFSTKNIGAIFTELSLPNNQVLNSLFVKFALFLGLPLWGIRLHSLIAGVLAVMLMVPIGIRLGRSRGAGFWSALFLLCSAPAAVYSQLARGYELQLFLLLLYTWGLLYQNEKKYTLPALLAIAAGGAGSILTLPTSAVYLGVITAGFFLLRPGRPSKALLFLLLAGVIFAACWYGFNFNQFRAGQQWGSAITSHKAFFNFAFKTLDPIIPLLWCPFLIAGIVFLPRRTGAVVLGGILIVLLSALVTRGGPPRVYMPIAAAAAFLCGAGADALTRRMKKFNYLPAAAALLCAAGGLYFNTGFWMPPDWYALYAKGKAQAQGTLVIYSGTNGFPVMWNNQPDSTEENGSRLSQSTLDRLLCFTSDGILNGVDTSYSETHLPLKLKGLPHEGGFLYALESISEPADGDSVLLITCNGEKSLDTLLFNEISQSGRFLRLNIFFEVQKEEEFVNIIRGGVIDKAAAFDWKKLPEKMKLFRIKEMERKTP